MASIQSALDTLNNIPQSDPRQELLRDVIAGIGSAFGGSNTPLQVLQARRQREFDQRELQRRTAISQLEGLLAVQKQDSELSKLAAQTIKELQLTSESQSRQGLTKQRARKAKSDARFAEETFDTRVSGEEAKVSAEEALARKRSADAEFAERSLEEKLQEARLKNSERMQSIQRNQQLLQRGVLDNEKAAIDLDSAELKNAITRTNYEIGAAMMDSDPIAGLAVMNKQVSSLISSRGQDPTSFSERVKGHIDNDEEIFLIKDRDIREERAAAYAIIDISKQSGAKKSADHLATREFFRAQDRNKKDGEVNNKFRKLEDSSVVIQDKQTAFNYVKKVASKLTEEMVMTMANTNTINEETFTSENELQNFINELFALTNGEVPIRRLREIIIGNFDVPSSAVPQVSDTILELEAQQRKERLKKQEELRPKRTFIPFGGP